MIDGVLTLETYSTKYNAAIAQISYALFDNESGEIYLNKSLNTDISNIEIDYFDVDVNTLDWLERLPQEVIKNMLSNQKPLFNVLNEINGDKLWETNIWCNTSFDVPVLMTAYQYYNFKGPTMYKFKDLQTLSFISGLPMYNKKHSGTEDIVNLVNDIVTKLNKLRYGE